MFIIKPFKPHTIIVIIIISAPKLAITTVKPTPAPKPTIIILTPIPPLINNNPVKLITPTTLIALTTNTPMVAFIFTFISSVLLPTRPVITNNIAIPVIFASFRGAD